MIRRTCPRRRRCGSVPTSAIPAAATCAPFSIHWNGQALKAETIAPSSKAHSVVSAGVHGGPSGR